MFVGLAGLTVIMPLLSLTVGFYMFQVSDHIRIYTTSVSMLIWAIANLIPALVLFGLTFFMWQGRLIELRQQSIRFDSNKNSYPVALMQGNHEKRNVDEEQLV